MDALAPAVFGMGSKRGLTFIEAMEGVEGLIVSSDGEVIISGGMKGKIRFLD